MTETKGPHPYQRKTDAQLKEIAKDLYAGKIFSSAHMPSPDRVRQVFMVLSFADEATLDRMKEDKITFIYEYLSEAGPMAINGMPTFFSLRTLNEEDAGRMFAFHEKVKEAMEGI